MDLRRVDLNLLVVLEVLLSERNVTRAARRLNMSQPATSTALARLRKQFDDPLLVKSGRTLRPTVRAQAIVEPLREVLRTLERSVLAAPGFDPATDSRTFTIMTGDYAAITLLRLLVRGSTPAASVSICCRSTVPVSMPSAGSRSISRCYRNTCSNPRSSRAAGGRSC